MGKEEEDKVSFLNEVMAKENGWHGDPERNHEASSSNLEIKRWFKGYNRQNHKDGEKKEKIKYTAPLYKLFYFADSIDVFLIILASIGALANGATLLVMTVLFGNLIESFGGAIDFHDVVHMVSKYTVKRIFIMNNMDTPTSRRSSGGVIQGNTRSNFLAELP